MRRVVFLVNPLLARRAGKRAAVDRCAAVLRAEACQVEVQETLAGVSAGQQAREAVESGFDTVFACGGDGTLFYVLQGVAGSGAALGIIPMGTGNILARNLRLPRDPEAALRAQWGAAPVEIPLGEILCVDGAGCETSWFFTIAAGIGFHSALMNLAPSGPAKRILGRGAYYAGGARLLLRNPQPFEVEITGVGGDSAKCSVCELLAVRVPAIDRWRSGGDLRSPHLRVAAVPHTGRAGLVHACLHAIVTRRSRGLPAENKRLPYPAYVDAVRVVCRSVDGFLYKQPLLVEADGEVVGAQRVTLRMARESLRLLWPGGA